MVNWLNGLLYGVGGIAGTCIVLLVTLQEKLVYVPVIPGMSKGYPITPSRLRLKYEDVWLVTKDGVRLHSWFIKAQPSVRGPTVLFFQENAGNIAHRLEFVDQMMNHLNCNVFMLSYRGYGASAGFPSQHGLTLDAQAALDFLLERADIDHSRIVVFGRSLGGAVGSALVANNPGKVSALVLENTFTSILDMAGVMMPILKYVISGTGSGGLQLLNFLVRSPWNTIELLRNVREPVLFLSGQLDEMVPPSHMRRLYQAASANTACQFIEFPTGMHMDTWLKESEKYWRVLKLYLEQYSNGAQSRSDVSTITSEDSLSEY
jgi:fermentation-respiration switch protein FrsA (DUF1100 family)